jgi:prepilin-type N-terminal cleavage/methylation domain-containing protein
MLITSRARQPGFSLIELMIAIALGLIIITGVVYLTSGTIRTNIETLRTTRLDQELRGVLLMLNRDLKRAGHYANSGNVLLCSSNSTYTLSATTGTSITATLTAGNGACNTMGIQANDMLMNITGVGSPTITTACAIVSSFTGTTLTMAAAACPGAVISVAFPSTTLDPGAWTIVKNGSKIYLANAPGDSDAGNDCITYGYDFDANGSIGANEIFGFRYNQTSKAIETLNGSGSLTDCTIGAWVKQTDESGVRITDLDIVETDKTNSAATVNVTLRELQITISGTLGTTSTDNIPVNRTYSETIKVRNDLLN